MRKKLIASAAISALMLMTTAIPALAADTDVMIETKPTTVNMTVPTTVPIVFNEDGTNVYPTNWTITNNSEIAGVHLSKVDMDAGASGWSLLPAGQDAKLLAANTKDIIFSMGKAGNLKTVAPAGAKAGTGTASWTAAETTIPAKGSQALSFDVKRGAFTAAQASAKAFDMTLTFNFN